MTRKECVDSYVRELAPRKDEPGVRAVIVRRFVNDPHYVDEVSGYCFEMCPGCMATDLALGVYGPEFFSFPELKP